MKRIITYNETPELVNINDLTEENLNTRIVIMRQEGAINDVYYGILTRLNNTYFFAGLNGTTNGWSEITGITPNGVIKAFTGISEKFYIFETKTEFAKWFYNEVVAPIGATN